MNFLANLMHTDFAGLITIGIGINTFVNGVWLLLYNSQNKRIDKLEKKIDQLINN
jgi:hypothetical protein